MANNDFWTPNNPGFWTGYQPPNVTLPGGFINYNPSPQQQDTLPTTSPTSIPSNLVSQAAPNGIKNGILSSVNDFGTNLGFASGQAVSAPSATFVGPMPAETGALTGTTATLTNTLGAAGLGALAGMYNPLAPHKDTAAVGGGIGAGIGYAFGGPIGGAIGAALGSTVLGQFGKPRPHPTSEFVGTVGGDVQYGTKHLDKSGAESVVHDFNSYADALKKTAGVDITGSNIYGGINDGSYFIRTNNGGSKLKSDLEGFENDAAFKYDPTNLQSKNQAFQDYTIKVLADKGQLTPEMEARVRGFQYSTPSGGGGSGAFALGMPMVTKKKPEASFSDFVKNYRNQQAAGAA
jgi:hypothetical protein